MHRAILPLSFCLSLVFTGVFPVASAHACLNGTIMEEDEMVKNVRLAERALERGQARKALRLLEAEHYMTSSKALLAKVKTVKAVAQLRTGKAKRAERVFRNMLKKDRDNPFLMTRLAESLHERKGEDAVEAWRILDDLEERDLIPDARGFAVLATLRARANDDVGEKRALARCKAMAGKQIAICS